MTLPCLNFNAREFLIKQQQQFQSAPLGEYSWLEVVKSGAWRRKLTVLYYLMQTFTEALVGVTAQKLTPDGRMQ